MGAESRAKAVLGPGPKNQKSELDTGLIICADGEPETHRGRDFHIKLVAQPEMSCV